MLWVVEAEPVSDGDSVALEVRLLLPLVDAVAVGVVVGIAEGVVLLSTLVVAVSDGDIDAVTLCEVDTVAEGVRVAVAVWVRLPEPVMDAVVDAVGLDDEDLLVLGVPLGVTLVLALVLMEGVREDDADVQALDPATLEVPNGHICWELKVEPAGQ